jgi:hypothetical protein
MKVFGVKFVTSGSGVLAAQVYNYLSNCEAEVGDYAVANYGLVEIVSIKSKDEYESMQGALNLNTLKEIKLVLSRKEEREELKRKERIAEIKDRLTSLRDKVETRRVFEDAAKSVGDEGKNLLAELEKLEGNI